MRVASLCEGVAVRSFLDHDGFVSYARRGLLCPHYATALSIDRPVCLADVRTDVVAFLFALYLRALWD